MLLGPGDAEPAALGAVLLPGQEAVETLLFVARSAATAELCEVALEALFEPGADLLSELLIGCGEGQIHGSSQVVEVEARAR
jgi:hypothetical protein